MKRIILLLLICVGLVLAGCAGQKSTEVPKATPTPTMTKEVSKPVQTPKPAVTPTPTPKKTEEIKAVQPPAKVKCELCHTKAVDYPPHKEGGKYCLKCHGKPGMTVAEVAHTVHRGVISCDVCHGKAPNLTIPKPIYPNQSVCVNCHNPKDPTKPCTNLVTIHLERGKYCTVCHTQPINVIHKAADEDFLGK